MDVREECPTCHGTGKIEPSLLFTDKLESECQRYMEQFGRGLTLRLHPFICAYVEKGFLWNSLKWQWLRKYGVKIASSQMLGMMEYRFFDQNLKPLLIPTKAVLTIDQKEAAKAKIYATKPIQEKPEVVLPEEPQKTVEEKSAEKPIEKPVEKPAEKTAEKPAEKPKKKRSSRKKSAKKAEPETQKETLVYAGPAEDQQNSQPTAEQNPAEEKPAEKKPAKKRAPRKKTATKKAEPETPKEEKPAEKPTEKPAKKRTTRKRTAKTAKSANEA